MRDFLKKRELLSRYSGSKSSSFEDERDILVTEVITEVWRRGEQSYDLRTELSLRHNKIKQAWFMKTQQYREMFEESRTAQSAAGPEIDQLRHREAELLREVRRHNNGRPKLWLYCQGIGQTWSPTNPGHQKPSRLFAMYAAKLCKCKHQLCHLLSQEILRQGLKKSKVRDSKSLQRCTDNTGFPEQFG